MNNSINNGSNAKNKIFHRCTELFTDGNIELSKIIHIQESKPLKHSFTSNLLCMESNCCQSFVICLFCFILEKTSNKLYNNHLFISMYINRSMAYMAVIYMSNALFSNRFKTVHVNMSRDTYRIKAVFSLKKSTTTL